MDCFLNVVWIVEFSGVGGEFKVCFVCYIKGVGEIVLMVFVFIVVYVKFDDLVVCGFGSIKGCVFGGFRVFVVDVGYNVV